MPSVVEGRRAKEIRRKRQRKGTVEWTLTNIGAALSLMGLMLAVFIFFNYLMTHYCLTVLAIPIAVLVAFGYALIVKDYYDIKRRKKEEASRRKTSSEEE
jgi:predicted membrane protein